jgi:hypothetical protein
MTKIERFIISQIKTEKYVLTIHARRRMNERFITDADIVDMARALKSVTKQDDNDTYLLSGLDSWGEHLYASVAVRDNVIIVTVFYKEELL